MKTFMQYLVENNNAVDKIVQQITSAGFSLIPLNEVIATEVLIDFLLLFGIGRSLSKLKKVKIGIYDFSYKLDKLDAITNEIKEYQGYLAHFGHDDREVGNLRVYNSDGEAIANL